MDGRSEAQPRPAEIEGSLRIVFGNLEHFVEEQRSAVGAGECERHPVKKTATAWRHPKRNRVGWGYRVVGKGVAERQDVEEYCVSEGWIRVPAGKTVDRRGQPLMIKIKGTVEAFYKDAGS